MIINGVFAIGGSPKYSAASECIQYSLIYTPFIPFIHHLYTIYTPFIPQNMNWTWILALWLASFFQRCHLDFPSQQAVGRMPWLVMWSWHKSCKSMRGGSGHSSDRIAAQCSLSELRSLSSSRSLASSSSPAPEVHQLVYTKLLQNSWNLK